MAEIKSYMAYPEYKSVMEDSQLTESKAVKLFLDKAAHFNHTIQLLNNVLISNPGNKALTRNIKNADDSRIQSVWQAIDTAAMEQYQGWKLIEDGDDFMSVVMVKYQGRLNEATLVERKTIEFMELLDEMKKRQQQGIWV